MQVTPQYLKQFDLICNSPIRCWQDGLSLGNGALSALFYTAEGFFPEWSVNLNTIWDERLSDYRRFPMSEIRKMAKGELSFVKEMQKETPPGKMLVPTPAYGAQLRLELGISPLHAPAPRTTNRLSLYNATLETHLDKHLSHSEMKSFISYRRNLLALRVTKVSLLTAFRSKVRLFRINDTEHPNAQTGTFQDIFYIRQELPTMSFVAAVKIVPTGRQGAGEYRELFNQITHPTNYSWGNPSTKITPAANDFGSEAYVSGDFDLFMTILKDGTVEEAAADLDKAAQLGWEGLYAEHCAEWELFWQRNKVSLGDAGLDQLWYLSNYHMKLGTGVNPGWGLCGPWFGRTPGTTQSLPWHGFFTNDYNAQTAPLALETINRSELSEGIYRMLHAQLPEARKNAALCECPGALYPLSSGPDGRETAGGNYRFCQGSGPYWCTLLYRHWLYTKDDSFLKDIAWDIIRETASFFAAYMTWDGALYHLTCSQNPELQYLHYIDPIDTLAFVKRTLEAACAIDERLELHCADRQKWEHILSHYPDYPVNDNGFSPLRGLRTDHVNHHRTLAPVYPLGEIDPEFPSGQIDDARKELDNPSWAFFMTSYACPAGHQLGWTGNVYHTALPACRFGRSDTAWQLLGDMIGGTLKPNGLFSHNIAILSISEYSEANLVNIPQATIYHDCGPEPMTLAEASSGRCWEETTEDLECKEKTFPVLEGPAVFLLLVSEMLLQSHNGLIRVFPAWPQDRDAQFENLKSEGALLVSASLKNGKVAGICIHATVSGEYSLLNPWTQPAIWQNGHETPAQHHMKFHLNAGEEVCFTPTADSFSPAIKEHQQEAAAHILDFGWGRRSFLGKPAPAAYYAGLASFLEP